MGIFEDEYGLRIGWVIVFAVSAAIGAVFLLGAGLTVLDKHYQRRYCQPRLEQMKREGKFVEYNFWQYECLAKTSKGTYLPIDTQINNTQE